MTYGEFLQATGLPDTRAHFVIWLYASFAESKRRPT